MLHSRHVTRNVPRAAKRNAPRKAKRNNLERNATRNDHCIVNIKMQEMSVTRIV
jgi:hypothetical protein